MVERNSSEEKPSTGFSKKYQRATDDKSTKTQSTDHRYQQIDSYGMIGNMRTCAHICKNNGSIDWFCFPHFSSPSIFARILDYDKGGFFEINVLDREGVEMKQGYWPDTNILVTHFTDSKGIGQVVDFMPVIATDPSSKDPDDFPDVRHCMEKSSMQVRDSVGSNSLMAVAPHIAGIHSIQETDKYQQIVRRVEVLQGTKSYVMQCAPAFNYGRDEHQLYLTSDKKRAIFVTEKLAMVLESTIAKLTPVLSPDKKNVAVKSSFSLSEETSETFIFREATKEEKEEALQYFIEKGAVKPKDEKEVQCVDIDSPYSSATQTKADWLFVQTMNYWHDWISKCNYQGRWREHIYRSALTLKLCIFEPTGAIVAAPTASLPESIGGTRNWDYRFTWLRDAAYVIYSLIRIGFYSEAEAFMSFLEKRCKESIHEDLIDIDLDNPDSFEGKNMPKEPPLKTIYTINGKNEDLEEVILDHFEGYKRSSPVRIGNAAATQFQLDIYGELMDSIYLYNKYSKPVSYDFWRYIVYIVNWVCANYGRKDEGVWEVRGGRQHFLYSKVLAWVCIDRGLRLADKRSFPAPRVHWQQSRDKLMNEIMKYGFNPKVQAFTQYYGSETLDASALILPLILFMSPSDPRMLSTLDAINRRPKKGGLVQNSLVFRYNAEETDDGFSGEAEGTFNMCTFWLIESLCRTGDKKRMMEARLKLEIFFSYSNHLGLFSEEMSTDGHQLGNYPQAFTHLSLISATFNLNRSLNKWRPMTVHQ